MTSANDVETESPVVEYLNKTTVLKCYSTRNPHSAEQLVHIVGTAHVSKKSCNVVQRVIRDVQPQAVFLELCRGRSEILKPPAIDLVNSDISHIDAHSAVQSQTKADASVAFGAWRRGEATLFDALYSWMLARFGSEMESLPGEEFRVAFEESQKIGAQVMLGDRPIQITVKRMWTGLSFWEKCRLCWHLLIAGIDIPDKEEILKLFHQWEDTDAITEVIKEFSEMFPSISAPLIDERNLYMIYNLRELSHRATSIVAVVGAGHIPGIKANWNAEIDISEIGSIPAKKPSYVWRYCLVASSCVAAGTVMYLRLRVR